MRPTKPAPAQPRALVYVTAADFEPLCNLAETGDTPGALLLARELERAIVVGEGEAPARFVRLGDRVTYRDLSTGKARTVAVVIPEAADIDENRLSVLSPVGAALIGLTAGAACSWTTEDGRPRVVMVERVEPAPAQAA